MIRLIIMLNIFISLNLFGQNIVNEIVTRSDNPYVNVIITDLTDDSLYVNSNKDTYVLPVDSIKYLRLNKDRPGYAGTGLVLGMVGGGILGNMIGRRNSDSKGFFSELGNDLNVILITGVGIVVGGLFGFTVGAGVERDEYYDLEKKTHKERIEILKDIMGKT